MSRMKRYERTDILVYFSANRGLKLHRRSSPDKYEFLTEYLQQIDKREWVIRRPRTNYEWLFLFGTQWHDKPTWEKAGWYDLNCDRGRKILFRCNFTAKERDELRQERLFDIP